jgi:hypothetical protein
MKEKKSDMYDERPESAKKPSESSESCGKHTRDARGET